MRSVIWFSALTLIVAGCWLHAGSAAAAVILLDTLDANDRASLKTPSGQTFTTGSLGGHRVLHSIEIEAARDPAVGALLTFALALYEDGDGDHATWDPVLGNLLGTSQVDTMATTALALTSFNFSGVTLDDNTVYAFMFVDQNGNPVHGARMGLAGGAGNQRLPDGTLFSAGVQDFGNNFDVAMRISMVPEPGTAAVALMGLAAVAVVYRRRQTIG